MRLTRRDVIAALGATGIVVSGGAAYLTSGDKKAADHPLAQDEQMTLIAVAEIIYPSEVSGVGQFVDQYIRGRAADHSEYLTGVSTSLQYIEDYAMAWYDRSFSALDQSDQSSVLRRMNADTTDPDPDGSDVERVRYYVINDLLFALYSTPTGGELVGIENPQGYPGGIQTYQQGPPSR